MALEAAPREVAILKLRRFLVYNKSFNCADVQVGDPVLVRKSSCRRGAPRWSGTAKILDGDNAGATATFQSQTFKVGRYSVWKKVDAQDVGEVGWSPASGGSDTCGRNTSGGSR